MHRRHLFGLLGPGLAAVASAADENDSVASNQATADALDEDLAGAILTIDLAPIQENWRRLRAAAAGAECGAAVKANAYGLGMMPVARALFDAGCRTFFVARPREGERLRSRLSDATIYVLDGFFAGEPGHFEMHRLRPALISLDEARGWAAFCRKIGRRLPCAIHVDTGINRLGFDLDEFARLTDDEATMADLPVALLMSHLACSDESGHPMNARRLAAFEQVRARLPRVPASLANSSGIFLGEDFTMDLVRPGLALYGGHAGHGETNPIWCDTKSLCEDWISECLESAGAVTMGSRPPSERLMKGALRAAIAAPFLAAVACAAPAADRNPFIARHCVVCHDAATPSGGLDLTAIPDGLSDPDGFARWATIHRRVQRSEMPPADTDQPPADEKERFLTGLDAALLEADETRIAATGRVRLRRLTRREFENTLVDLLALPRLDITGLLPADGRVAGYDKVAAGLDISPAHLDAYAEAIEQALDAAIATRSTPPPVFTRRIHPAGLFKFEMNLVEGQFVLLADKHPDPALPVRGGFEDRQGHVGAEGPDLTERRAVLQAVKAAGSTSAVGLLNPNLAGYEAALNVAPIHAGHYRLRISLWGFRWAGGRPEPCAAPGAAVLRAHAEGKQQEGGRTLRLLTAPSLESREEEFVTWLEPLESIVFDPVSIPWNGLRIGQVAGRAARHEGPGVAIDWFEIEGPLNDSWPPESHQRLFGSLPIAAWPTESDALPPKRVPPRGLGGYLPNFHVDIPVAERTPPLESVRSDRPVDDARRLLEGFLPRAFRRDVAPDEIEPYLTLFESRLAARDCFEDAMRRVYVAVLTSPEFLFLPAEPAHVDGFTLASRLSYWLWNGPPDEAILAAARDRSLLRPAVIEREVDRLLADRRSDRFIDDFVDQWLELRRVAETTPDPRLYPEYRFLLHEGVVAEPRSFVRELIRDDLPARALLQPGFAMLTQRLAEHYGIEGVHGVEVRRVSLPPGVARGGLLGQAAIHKLTANGTTTSPVTRGTWVKDRLLDEPPPPPPPGIAAIDPDTRGTTTVREQLERHRADATCAACHARIDPPGFALEAFDPVGGLRQRYRSSGQGLVPPERGRVDWRVTYTLGPEVDASGTLADGRTFTGPASLIGLLAADSERLAEAFVAHLSRYATGADVGYADRAEIRRIVAAARPRQYGLKSLVHGLARSRLLGAGPPSVSGGGAP